MADSEPTASTSTPPATSSPKASASSLLTFPTQEAPATLPPPKTIPASKKQEILSNRLYVGNLHPTIDESSLLKIFSKCGKVSRLDYLFHKSGPAKGKPRGYAFVEFSDPKEAKKAVDNLHDRAVRGRKLIVSFATQSSHADAPFPSSSHSGPGGPMRRRHDDANRTTTLSLIKTPSSSRGGGGGGGGGGKGKSTESKIAQLEAKLKELRDQPATGVVAPTPGSGSGLASLPRKPAPPRGGYGIAK
ncbi:RNA-binding domain-containing protein [Clavulina sp. PMI_390]|nr:RNA-binding domain-containing protein [Clavulina sp. PMI_390]